MVGVARKSVGGLKKVLGYVKFQSLEWFYSIFNLITISNNKIL